MHTTDTLRTSTRDYLAVIQGYLARIGRGFDLYLDSLSRADEVRRLDAMSDDQLARIGIRRDEIVRYVFRDKIHAS